MADMLETLSQALRGTPAVALAAAFAWGVLSLLLSPCHLASIPLIVGFIDKQGRVSARRAFLISLVFALGILVTFGVVGVITAEAGRRLGDSGPWANYAVAIVFFVVGLHLLDVIPIAWSGVGQVKTTRKGLLAALVLGLTFGAALGPCTFAWIATILGVTFKAAAGHAAFGLMMLAAFGVGHCSVIVVAGTATGLVQRYLNWNERSRGSVILRKICGALVIAGGLYLIYTA